MSGKMMDPKETLEEFIPESGKTVLNLVHQFVFQGKQ